MAQPAKKRTYTMEINTNKKVASAETRSPEVHQTSAIRDAELRATVERVKNQSVETSEVLARIQPPADSIELSSGLSPTGETDRSARIAELRSAVEDGSLFDNERLERAATRLLSDQR